jgi:hypothetical protein
MCLLKTHFDVCESKYQKQVCMFAVADLYLLIRFVMKSKINSGK